MIWTFLDQYMVVTFNIQNMYIEVSENLVLNNVQFLGRCILS